ncbi:hypothetical protein EZS27_009234 [termite gut metagenome]|uniref:Tetratricopeptide repeat protein n=1 Tax=termite gut metagenome TaxID=433724 RepID=A0A5J4SBE5_9ZZZZ
MIKKLYLPLLMGVVVVALSSCSSKLGELGADFFALTPPVLEATAGKVPVTITGTFPQNYFNKNAIVEVTPVLRWEGGEARGEKYVYQGENVQGNNTVIPYQGGSVTLKTSYDYIPQMAKSELYLEFEAQVNGKATSLPAIKVGDGVISTSTLVTSTIVGDNIAAFSSDAFQRIIKEAKETEIKFLIQQANIRESELKGQSVKEFNKQIVDVNAAANKQISNIGVSSYASPDGGLDLNTKLAQDRAISTEKYLNQQFKSGKIKDVTVDSKSTAEDWAGFQELVSKSDLQDKDLILRVLSMYNDPEQREREIKNISTVYKTLADEILPQLRRSRLILNYEIIGKSDEELSNLANTNPSQLDIEELIYAATLTNNDAEKETIYNSAISQYPNDYRAYNNAGVIAYQAANLDKAESLFKKAASIKAAPEVNLNLGLISLAKGDNAAAESYLGNASGAEGLNEALGNLYIAQGQYERAVNSFGDSKTNSAALAQILTNDYNKANATLNSISNPDANTDYLSAIVGARTNNASLLTSSLKKAVQKNPSLSQKAASDIEFEKYRSTPEFTDIIK